MSILISDLRLPFPATEEETVEAARRVLGVSMQAVKSGNLHKRSLDLRHGGLRQICSVELSLDLDETALVAQRNCPQIRMRTPAVMPRPCGREKLHTPPVIIGFGPAGIFSALVLARNGYRPIVLERGAEMAQRDADVNRFFSCGQLNANSNIQFGEGGAGAYSDGKLTTRIGDTRCELVLKLLTEHGAPEAAMKLAKPHVGTDLLKDIVVSMREEIRALGGEVRFHTPVKALLTADGVLKGLAIDQETLSCQTAIMAIGHSARDSFLSLAEQGVAMQSKAFSVGVRVEHLQSDIDAAVYGKYAGTPQLPPAEYVLSRKEGERACYSFCMCPGGEVVAAASEAGGVVTNGMSYHARGGSNANAAVCVSVGPADFGAQPLDGMRFQRSLEQSAFQACGGHYAAPVQLLGDFIERRPTRALGRVTPTYPLGHRFCQMDELLPDYVCDMLRRSFPVFGKKLHGYDAPDAVLTGIETRTSSPVRILRGDNLYSPSVSGLIPSGEGAGYAGGIMSAAVDGIRAAEAIMERYQPLD